MPIQHPNMQGQGNPNHIYTPDGQFKTDFNTDQHQMNPKTLSKCKSSNKLCNRHNHDISTANLSTVRSSKQMKRSKSSHAQVQKGQSKIDISNGNM